MSRRQRLSFSAMEKYNTCPRQFRFERLDGLRAVKTSVNLVYGRVVDEVITTGLRAVTLGQALPDVAQMFGDAFAEAARKESLEYTNKALDYDAFQRIGQAVLPEFFRQWQAQGLQVALLPGGEPALQLELDAELGDDVGYKAIIDVLAINREGELGVLDVKTASAASFEEFHLLAPQLTDYQMEVEANAQALGIHAGDVAWLGFAELLKKKTTPEVVFSPQTGRRNAEQVEDRIADIKAAARGINAAHFPKRPGLAFNSPCRMCEFRSYCLTGDMTGLVIEKLAAAPMPGVLGVEPRKRVERKTVKVA